MSQFIVCGSMQVKLNDSLNEFISLNHTWLEQKEAQNNLLLGLSNSLKDGSYPCKKPLLLTIEDGENQVGAVLQTPPNDLVISELSDEACKALCVFLTQHCFVLPGVIGTLESVEKFQALWTSYQGIKSKLSYQHLIYELQEVSPPRPVEGELVQADQADFQNVKKWIAHFQEETLGGARKGQEDIEDIAHRRIKNKEIYLWEVDGVPVSMSGISGKTKHGVRINAVYTPEKDRKKGYASNCVAALANRMLNSGKSRCFLYADKNNPTSNAIYQQVGFKFVCESACYKFV